LRHGSIRTAFGKLDIEPDSVTRAVPRCGSRWSRDP
jgi:hypothetical protein